MERLAFSIVVAIVLAAFAIYLYAGGMLVTRSFG